MYLGRLVEQGDTRSIFKRPAHPYTKALMAVNPVSHPKNRGERFVLGGDVPSPLNPPSGCHFHPRCTEATDRCKIEQPTTTHLEEHHTVKCHLYN